MQCKMLSIRAQRAPKAMISQLLPSQIKACTARDRCNDHDLQTNTCSQSPSGSMARIMITVRHLTWLRCGVHVQSASSATAPLLLTCARQDAGTRVATVEASSHMHGV